MLMASKPVKILREEEEAMHAASKAMQLEKPLGDDEYEGPPVSLHNTLDNILCMIIVDSC